MQIWRQDLFILQCSVYNNLTYHVGLVKACKLVEPVTLSIFLPKMVGSYSHSFSIWIQIKAFQCVCVGAHLYVLNSRVSFF